MSEEFSPIKDFYKPEERKFQIKFKDYSMHGEFISIKIFDDVQFKDQYVIATSDDAVSETLYIPYYSILNMKLIKENENV